MNAAPTTESQPSQGARAAEKCAAVLPGKAPSVIKTNLPPTQKPVAKAKAPAPTKTLEKSWQPWRSTVSVLVAVFFLAPVAMSCSAFGLVAATSLTSEGGAQPALYANMTGDLDVVACHPAGIYFNLIIISGMADDQRSVLSVAGNALLHREAVCGELGVRCDAAGLMAEAVHANMLRPSAPGLGGFRLSDWHNLSHQNTTEGMPRTLKSLPCMHYLKLPVPTISSNPQLGLHDSGMSSSLVAVKEANLLAGSADFGSPLKESASLAEQCSTGETNSAIGHALQQRHRSGVHASVGGVGWLPQWAPFFLAQVPSPPQPPPSVQRFFSLFANKPPRQPSPPVLGNSRSPTAPSSPGALSTMVSSTPMVASTRLGPVMRMAPSGDAALLVLHGRKLSEVTVSTVAELTTAVGNSALAAATKFIDNNNDLSAHALGLQPFLTGLHGRASHSQARPTLLAFGRARVWNAAFCFFGFASVLGVALGVFGLAFGSTGPRTARRTDRVVRLLLVLWLGGSTASDVDCHARLLTVCVVVTVGAFGANHWRAHRYAVGICRCAQTAACFVGLALGIHVSCESSSDWARSRRSSMASRRSDASSKRSSLLACLVLAGLGMCAASPPSPPVAPEGEDLDGRRRFPPQVNHYIIPAPSCNTSYELPGRVGCVRVPRSVMAGRYNARFEHADCIQNTTVGCMRLPHTSPVEGVLHGGGGKVLAFEAATGFSGGSESTESVALRTMWWRSLLTRRLTEVAASLCMTNLSRSTASHWH